MDLGLIKAGTVENVITAESVELAQQLIGGYDNYIERQAGEVWGPGWAYDGQSFTEPDRPVAAPVRVELTRYQFLARIPTPKRIAIRAAAKEDPIIEDAMMMLDMATGVFVDDPMTVGLVTYLQAAGFLSAEEAAAVLA